MVIRFVFCLAVVMLLYGCQGDPYSRSYTRTKPEEAAIIGTWVPDEATVKDMESRGRYDISKVNTRLIFRGDGSFDLIDMPDWWRDNFGISSQRFESFSGTWKLGQHPDSNTWEIDVVFNNMSTNLGLRNQSQPYLVHAILGDPDSGEAMTFVRKSPEAEQRNSVHGQ